MAYRIIILFLLPTFFQNLCWAQRGYLVLLPNFERQIDSIVHLAIENHAFPGCVIYASQHGEPFFLKSYGFHTYDSIQVVTHTNLYDLASLTKVMASTLALMKLYDDGLLDLDAQINDYVGGLGWSKVGNATIRQTLAHQAGLKSWISYYTEIQRRNGKYGRKTISSKQSEEYPYQIAYGKYLHRNFYQKIKKLIRKAKVNPDQGYVYSGLFFYLVPEMIKTLTGLEFSEYLNRYFYRPLNAESVMFNPEDRYDKFEIVPTEVDTFFRNHPIHGKVHDEGAILMKGVSGNAGLFGNVGDIAKVWHMLLNDGAYDTLQLIKPQTIDLFTAAQFSNEGNRRGLGFDKPLLEYDSLLSSVARSASFESYGHSGYTGTLVWADPQNDLLFIFLSNRVYPTRENRAIYELNVRPSIHQLLYDYAAEYEKFKIFRTLLEGCCCF